MRVEQVYQEREQILPGFWQGVISGLPIAMGYIPLAISFGVLAVQAGIPMGASVLMSVMVYAGASQFMVINMILLGSLGAEIVVATFVLNFRHFIMSMSFLSKFSKLGNPWRIGLCLGLTDESFTMGCLTFDKPKAIGVERYLAGLMITAYSAWVGGTFIGGLLAFVIPPEIGMSMSIALYAMFIGLLVPAVKACWTTGVIALAAAIFSTALSYLVSAGWAIVLAAIFASFLGVFFDQGDQ